MVAVHIDDNYRAFVAQLPALLAQQRLGQFALMRDKAIVECFDSAGDAYKAGRLLYSDGRFSIQEVHALIPDPQRSKEWK